MNNFLKCFGLPEIAETIVNLPGTQAFLEFSFSDELQCFIHSIRSLFILLCLGSEEFTKLLLLLSFLLLLLLSLLLSLLLLLLLLLLLFCSSRFSW